MPLRKDVKGFGMPWEDQYGYAQAVRVDDTIYVSGQLSHDEQGNMVGAAPLDDSGKIRDHSNMAIQMRRTYANAKKILGEFGATLPALTQPPGTRFVPWQRSPSVGRHCHGRGPHAGGVLRLPRPPPAARAPAG